MCNLDRLLWLLFEGRRCVCLATRASNKQEARVLKYFDSLLQRNGFEDLGAVNFRDFLDYFCPQQFETDCCGEVA